MYINGEEKNCEDALYLLKSHVNACTFHMELKVQAKQQHIIVLANSTQSHKEAQQTQATRNRFTLLYNLVPNNQVNQFALFLSLAELNITGTTYQKWLTPTEYLHTTSTPQCCSPHSTNVRMNLPTMK